MDKKDIYEHLAEIYLDASWKKKQQTQKKAWQKNFLVGVPIFVGVGIVLSVFIFSRAKTLNSQIALVLKHDVAKINFNFHPAKKEIFSLDLNKLSLSRFKTLIFLLRKANYSDYITLKVEFINEFKETAEIYLKDIPHKWKEYTLNLSAFGKITDWNQMSSLSFIVEEWNTQNKSGVVYLDNIRLVE